MSLPIVTEIVSRLDENLRDAWEERAAVMQWDAGIQRDLAEALALLLAIGPVMYLAPLGDSWVVPRRHEKTVTFLRLCGGSAPPRPSSSPMRMPTAKA